jgi:hypothetical protein
MQKRPTAALLAILVGPGALFVGTGTNDAKPTPRAPTDASAAVGLARRLEQLRR